MRAPMRGRGGKRTFVREFEFIPDEDWYLALPFDMEGGTQGRDLDEAVYMASDWLRLVAQDALAKGRDMPETSFGHVPRRGGTVIAIGVEVALSDVPAMTASEAARYLGVSRARITQLCKAGLLDSWRVGATRMVSVRSLDARSARGDLDRSPVHREATAQGGAA